MLIYPDRFAGNERRVELKGEAYFKVKSNKEHPFIIKTPQKAFIKVHEIRIEYPSNEYYGLKTWNYIVYSNKSIEEQ